MLLYVVGGTIVLVLVVLLARRYANRSAKRALLRHRARVDRFKLANRANIRADIIADPAIAEAVREHAKETGVSEAVALKKVHSYITEIVPFFNVTECSAIDVTVCPR